jgi:hypothetical protein
MQAEVVGLDGAPVGGRGLGRRAERAQEDAARKKEEPLRHLVKRKA